MFLYFNKSVVDADTINTFKSRIETNTGLIKMLFTIFTAS